MLPASTLREPPIPPPQADQPNLMPEGADRIAAAIHSLLRLVLFLTVMRLFGYRLSRAPRTTPRPAAAAPPAPTPAPLQPSTPAAPRRPHRTINRQMCLDMLAGINSAVAATHPQPTASLPSESAPDPVAPSGQPEPIRAPQPPPRPRCGRTSTRAPSPHALAAIRPQQRPRPHPPPKSPLRHLASTHAQFVPCT
jgi:hypothetical protein